MVVTAASPVQPAGTPVAVMLPPFREMQLTSTSPWATPAGLAIVSVVLVAVFVAWLTDSRTMLLPPPEVATLQVCVAAVASVFPAASVPQTLKVWDPIDNPVYVWGEVHAVREAPSRLHWNVELASLEVKAKEALVDVDVAGGPDVIVVSGGVVSAGGAVVCTVHV